MLLAHEFNPEIINHQSERDWSPHMPPESWRELAWIVPIITHAFHKKIVGYLTGLREPVDSFLDSDVHPSIVDNILKFVLVNDFLRYDFNWKTPKFWALHRCTQVEVRDVHRELFCSRCGQD